MEQNSFNCNEIFHQKRMEYGLLLAKLKPIKSKHKMTIEQLQTLYKVKSTQN